MGSEFGTRPQRAHPELRVVLGLTALMLVHHALLWAWTSFHRGFPLLEALDHWDSEHYSTIVAEGYRSPLWAFLPLYPGAVRLVRALLGGGLPPQVVGTLLSTALLLCFVTWASRRAEREGEGEDSRLVPRTAWGWFFFLFSPASFALHSHHTEALFVLLSFGALTAARDGRVWLAAIFAGLCVWTRNQGVFVAVAAALLVVVRERQPRSRLAGFTLLGSLSLAAYGGLLAFEWYAAGDPLAHVHAQKAWSPPATLSVALESLWRDSPWNTHALWPVLRNVFAAVWLVASVALLRRSWPLGLYGLLSLVVMVPQGHFGNVFRYGASVFPVLFWVGDWLAARPAWLRWPVALFTLWVNHKMAHAFITGRWAY